ncbi:MAG: serine protease [Polyangiaceae bacterium]
MLTIKARVWLLLVSLCVACGGGTPEPKRGGDEAAKSDLTPKSEDDGQTAQKIPESGRVSSEKLIERRAATALAPDSLDTVKARSRPPKSSKEVYRQVAPATVIIRVPGGMGSGVIIDPSGWVLTNHHVVADGKQEDFQVKVEVLLGHLSKDTGGMERDEKTHEAMVYKVDKLRDLALLKIKDPPGKLPYVKLAKDKPVPGDQVVSLGHAGAGMLWAIKAGQVSALGKLSEHLATLASFSDDDKEVEKRFKEYLDKQNLGLVIQSSCEILPGDSGGPLVNAQGELVGLNAFSNKDSKTGGLLSFHVHLDEVKKFAAAYPAKPERLLPDPWREGGGDVALDDVDFDGSVDTMVLHGRQPCVFCPRESEAVFVDLDEDSFKGKAALPKVEDIYEKKAFDAELMFLRVKSNSFIWYDTDNDGSFDLLLYDAGTTGSIDAAYDIDQGGDLTSVGVKRLGRAVRGSAFDDKALSERMLRIAGTVFPSSFIESRGKVESQLPDPLGNTGSGTRGDLNDDGRPDAVLLSSPFSARLLVDVDGNVAPRLSASPSVEELRSPSMAVDFELAVVSQGDELWAWYDTDDDGRHDLVLHSPGSRVYVAAAAWRIDASGKRSPAPEQVGRKLIRPALLQSAALRTQFESMVQKGLLGILSAKGGDGIESFPDPIEDHRGAGMSLMDIKGASKTVIAVNGQGSDGYLLDLDESTFRATARKKIDISKTIKDKKLDLELAYFQRNGFAWVFYDTKNKGFYDLVLYTSNPRGGKTELAFHIQKDGKVSLDAALEGKSLVQPSLLSGRSRSRLKKVAPEIFSSAMIGE